MWITSFVLFWSYTLILVDVREFDNLVFAQCMSASEEELGAEARRHREAAPSNSNFQFGWLRGGAVILHQYKCCA